MRIVSFDLSSVCIGVVVAEVEGSAVTKIASTPIVPPRFNPEKLGFNKSKKKVYTAKGKLINTYVKPDETQVSEAEKKRRDRLVRSQKDIETLQYIGKEIGDILRGVRPDLILVEKNAIFNGILTSILLAKVMGVLLGVAGELHVPVQEYTVAEARSCFNVTQLTHRMVSMLSEEEINTIPDTTKRALRMELERIYPVCFKTDDESDACVVFHYWLTEGRKK